MRNFAYTARDSGGALRRGALDASDRVAALEALRRQGLTPVALDEAGAGRDASPMRPSPRALAYAAAALVLLAVVGAWLAKVGTAPRAVRGRLGDASLPVAAERRLPPAAPPAPAVPAPAREDARPPAPARGDARPADPARGDARPPAPAREDARPPAPARGDARPPAPPDPSFVSLADSAMAMIASVPPGTPVPPLPISGDLAEDFAAAATNTIVIFDDDTEEAARHKEAVAWMKQDVAEYVKEGHPPAAVIQAITDVHNENARIREEFSDYLGQLRAAGDTEGSAAFVKEANKDLAARGLPLLQLRETTMAERKAMREKR